jgi:hypothetical protein
MTDEPPLYPAAILNWTRLTFAATGLMILLARARAHARRIRCVSRAEGHEVDEVEDPPNRPPAAWLHTVAGYPSIR